MTASGVDVCSQVPLYVEAWRQDLRLAEATAFCWFRPDLRLSLITNWHVASGRNQETGQSLHRGGAWPDRLRVHLPFLDRAKEPLIVDVPTLNAELEPLWTEHPLHGRAVDVVSLEFAPPEQGMCLVPMNAVKQVELKQRVGMPIFVLGYPFGRRGLGMPIWKQATFASEPYLSPHLDQLYLTVDTASRPGMSGSPAIQRAHGLIELEDGRHGRMESGDGASSFVGVYSGRFHTEDPQDAQLGRVWPRGLVEEIVRQAMSERAGGRWSAS